MKWVIAIIIIVAVVLTVSAVEQVYIRRDGAGATVFWKGDEAYLFLGTSSDGYHLSYLEYPVAAAREYFYAPALPLDRRVSTMVVRVASSGVERFHIEYGNEPALEPDFVTPFEDSFYAMCVGGTLCKWSGNEFISATQDEQQRFGGLNNLFRGDINNRVVNGWSVKQLRTSPGDHFEIQLGNGFSISANNRATDIRQLPSVSVVMRRPGRTTEKLYDVDGSPRWVSRAEYEKTFGRL